MISDSCGLPLCGFALQCVRFEWAGRYYGPDFQLHIQPSNMENLNTQEYLERSVQSSSSEKSLCAKSAAPPAS